MVLGVQILGIIFAIGISYFTYLSFKKRDLNKIEFFFWFGAWVIFLFIVLFPKSLGFLTAELSFSRTFDMLTAVGILFLTILTFHNYIVVRRNEKRTSEMVRKFALENKK